ncbi:MAG: peptidylprolyl isomerase, partial [Planctomycetales bacterium]|nr:peptidylprolyl isomerase [Planctomycetales bacterium]
MSRNRIRFFFGTVLAATLLLSAHSYTSAQQTRRTNPVRSRNQTPAARPTANRAATGNAAAAKPSPRTTSQTAAGKKPQVMAVVNGETISRTDLAKECLKRYGEPVLESVVNKSLIFQECKRKGITVSAQDVEQEIAHMAERFNMSVGRWLELLQEERNVTAEQYRRDIIWPTVALKRLVASELTVSPEELANEFESEYGPKVQVRMIATNSQNDANAVLAKAKAGEDFGKLAKNHSVDANSAAARGLIPPIRKHMGDDAIEKVAFALKPGEVSQVIPFANQFLILKCERHLAASQISPEFKQDAENRLKEQILD